MLSYITLGILAVSLAYAVHTYRCFAHNLAAAKQSGLPYICTPWYNFNRFWLVTHRLWLPFLEALPADWTKSWLEYMSPDFVWAKKYDSFRELGCDCFLIVSPGYNTLYVADPEANNQITTRRTNFPKPVWIYNSVDIFGKNVVSTEGANWRHHRKITSPPFTEKNNHVVWQESLNQAQSMLTGWVGKEGKSTGAVWDVSAQAMRLSLHVISRAGFGVKLAWPHEDVDTKIPPGHTMSYKDALSDLLENIIVVILSPRWLLARSPLKIHKTAYEALVNWGQYMTEMYHAKRDEVRTGETREGMDLMGALVKGAGITANDSKSANGHSSVNHKLPSSSPPSKQLLTDDEILGNAFVFILAGHETAANTIHFSLLYLAMHWSAQTRLHADLDAIFGDRPVSDWNYDSDVPKLFGSMCGAVMNEELRLIPPVVGIPKVTTKLKPEPLVLSDGRRVTVPADCYVNLNTAAVHRNPKYWPHTSEEDLLEFRPERWLLDPSATNHTTHNHTQQQNHAPNDSPDDDGPDTRPDTSPSLFRPPKGAYIPFSDGHRSCLGRRFAQVEILAVLAVLFKHWSVELDVSSIDGGLSDAELERASEGEKRRVWEKADARARGLLRDGMMTIITIQMRRGKVPMRFVRRGEERFRFG